MPLEKPQDVVDRNREWEALKEMWQKSTPQLAFMVGRRRVGKSYLLSRFVRAAGGIYYQATRRTESEQLTSLEGQVGDYFDDAALRQGAGFGSWEGLFGYLAERTRERPLFIALDEFPYLTEAAPALPSILQQAWDHQWKDAQIKLVLSGSYISAMEELEASDQPLYGRRTARLTFKPFTFADVGAFVAGYSGQDVFRTYGLIGHLPGHLALLDPAASFEENAARLLLNPQSRLVDDAAHMLDAFLGESSVHYAIIDAIANGEATWSGITSRVGRSGGALSRPLKWLEGMGLVERVVPITEKKPSRSRRVLYRITDPYVSFWHRAIAPLLHGGSIGLASPTVLWEEAVAPAVDDHMGAVFEDACRDFVRAQSHAGEQSALPITPIRVGEWWDASSNEQVDVVALDARGDVLIGECKWGGVTGRHLSKLKDRAKLLSRVLDANEVHLALFSGSGEADQYVRAEAESGTVAFFTSDNMLSVSHEQKPG